MINAGEEAGSNVVVTMIFLPILLDALIKVILIAAAFHAAAYADL